MAEQEKNDRIWEEIRRETERLKYGSVLITVHDGKVVQIETSEKIRYQ